MCKSNAFAAAFALATVLAFATVVVAAAFAAALTFAGIFAFAVVFAHVTARRVRAGSVGAGILCLGDDAGHQSGDGRSDKECSLCSAHNVFLFCFFMKNRRSTSLNRRRSSEIRDSSLRFIPDNFSENWQCMPA
jgi:hypothetical protein